MISLPWLSQVFFSVSSRHLDKIEVVGVVFEQSVGLS